jgi:hypothetical protein
MQQQQHPFDDGHFARILNSICLYLLWKFFGHRRTLDHHLFIKAAKNCEKNFSDMKIKTNELILAFFLSVGNSSDHGVTT